jgi:hypothetical protein
LPNRAASARTAAAIALGPGAVGSAVMAAG